jgi:hypothetical protein
MLLGFKHQGSTAEESPAQKLNQGGWLLSFFKCIAEKSPNREK